MQKQKMIGPESRNIQVTQITHTQLIVCYAAYICFNFVTCVDRHNYAGQLFT